MYNHPNANRDLARHGRHPRLLGWLFFTVLLILAIAWLSPPQLPVMLYKVAMVTMGAVLGYWIDRALFPYARPHKCKDWAYSLTMLRRALIVLACVLGMTLGL